MIYLMYIWAVPIGCFQKCTKDGAENVLYSNMSIIVTVDNNEVKRSQRHLLATIENEGYCSLGYVIFRAITILPFCSGCVVNPRPLAINATE